MYSFSDGLTVMHLFVCMEVNLFLYILSSYLHHFIGLCWVRPCVAQIIIWHLISCMVVIMFGMHGVSDSANFFLRLVDVFDAGNKLMFIHEFVV